MNYATTCFITMVTMMYRAKYGDIFSLIIAIIIHMLNLLVQGRPILMLSTRSRVLTTATTNFLNFMTIFGITMKNAFK